MEEAAHFVQDFVCHEILAAPKGAERACSVGTSVGTCVSAASTSSDSLGAQGVCMKFCHCEGAFEVFSAPNPSDVSLRS